MVKHVACICLLAVALPYVYSFGITIGGTLTIPPLTDGTRVDLLISLQLVLEIAGRPNPNNTVYGCATRDSHVRNVQISSSTNWYKAGDGTYFMAVVLDPSFTQDEINTIYTGMIDIQNKSCFRFYIYSESSIQGYDYVYIQRGIDQGCYSDRLGRGGVGKQTVNLQPDYGRGTCVVPAIVSHELLHAIGFAHQQNAPGRDRYVRIEWGNIQSGAESQFQEVSSTQFTEYGYAYDYGSVMHYGAYDFSSNGGKTITTLNGASIGQRNAISSVDGNKLNKKYSCPTQ